MKNKDLSALLGCRPFNVPAYLQLLKLAAQGDNSLTDLQKVLGWAQPTVSEKVMLMRKRGFVRVEFRGRFKIVGLTDAGKRVLEEVKEGESL